MFALLLVGYLVGVWTACLVLRQSQGDYEDGARRQPATVPVPMRQLK